MSFGTAAAPQQQTAAMGSGGQSTSRIHSIAACNDAIQAALASGASAFTESLTKQATSLLSDPFAPLLATIAASTGNGSSTATGLDRDESDRNSVLYEPYYEAAHISSGLISLLLHASGGTDGGMLGGRRRNDNPADTFLASIAPALVSSLIRFLSKGEGLPTPPPSAAASSTTGTTTAATGIAYVGNGAHNTYGGHGNKAHPLLLAGQALFLLTRRYQCTEQHVRELAALMEVLLDILHNHGVSRGSTLHQLHEADATQNLCAIAYLSTWSLCNALACWCEVTRTGVTPGATTTTRASNQILSSATVGVFVDEWLRKTVARLVTGSSSSSSSTTGGGGGAGSSSHSTVGGLGGGSFLSPRDGNASRRSQAPSGNGGLGAHFQSSRPRSPGEYHHHSSSSAAAACLPLAFLPLVQLALGAFLVAKRDVDKGCEAITAACLAHRSGGSGEGGGVAGLGKVFKRIRQLAPSEDLLAIPVALVAEVPFLLVSFLLDDALPAMHHIADLDLRSYHQFLERQREEELAALQGGSQFYAGARRGSAPVAYYGINQQHPHPHGGGASSSSSSTPFAFSCGFAHCISAMAWCLGQLPPSYAAAMPIEDGDDADGEETAFAFFTFHNGPAHLRAIFELQRQDAMWEPFAHKTAAAFLELLGVFCRHPVTAERVTQLLAESQMECTELQWGTLFAQARECAGLSQTGSTATALMQATQPAGAGAAAASSHALRQASPAYLRKQQERFLLETLRLFRAVVEASQVPQRPVVSPDGLPTGAVGYPQDASTLVALQQIITLDIGFAFLQSDRLTPTGLGDVLTLIGFLIRSPSDAERVWSALEDAGLLRVSSSAMMATGVAASSSSTRPAAARPYAIQHSSEAAAGGHMTSMSLLAHAQREVHVGDHPITRGLLSLLYGILRHLQPTQNTHYASVSAVMRFVAEDIAAGSRKRAYVKREEGLVVLALSCAVLSQACTLPFAQQQPGGALQGFAGAAQSLGASHSPVTSAGAGASAAGSAGSAAVPVYIPMNTLTASLKAPADVLGDVLDAIFTLANKSFAQSLSSVEVTLLRQALEFLKHIMGGSGSNNKRDAGGFPVEARTSSNSDFVVSLLKLVASCDDPVVAQDSIALLSLLTSGALSQATRFLMMRVDVSCRLREAFGMLLDPQTVNQTTLRVFQPLRMLSLWHEGQATVPGYEVRTMSLFLDLMVKCAAMPHPSLFSWLIGCQLHHQRMPPPPPPPSALQENNATGSASRAVDQNDAGRSQQHVCLEAIVRGANDKELATTRALVHTKFIRLLFLLKVHSEDIRNHSGIAAVLQARSSESYLSWVLHCGGAAEETAESIAQHGLCLKTIALDAFRRCLASSSSAGSRSDSGSFGASSSSLRILQRLLADNSTTGLNAVQYDGRGSAGAYGSAARPSSSLYPLERFRSRLDDEDSGDVDDDGDDDAFTSLSPFRDWPAHVLRALEVFPNLPVPPGGLEQYVRVTPDGTPRYAIEELYRAFISLVHAEMADRGGAAPSQRQLEEVLRQRLVPYLDANRCLTSYASALVFIEGWTNVIEVGTALNAPKTAASAAYQDSYGRGSAAGAVGGADAGAVNHLSIIVNALSTEELLRYLHSIMEAIDATSNFTVAAQEQIASTLSRAVTAIVGKLKQVVAINTSSPSDRGRGGAEHHDHEGSQQQQQWNRSDVQRTLSAILNTLCLVGSRSAALRADLYNSLVMFLTLKHLPIDPILLFRAQSMLFSLLLNDINELSAPTLQLAALNCLRIVLELSPQLCDAFCGAQNGAGGCAPTLSQFSASAIAAVETIVMDVLLHGSRDIAIASYIIQSIFDIFVLASQQHADAVYRANAFALCNRMKVWPVGTRQMLDAMSGLTNAASTASEAAATMRTTTQGFAADIRATSQMLHTGAHALLQRTVIGVLRWYNTAIRSLLPFEDAIAQLADLINVTQLLLQLAASPGVLHAVQQSSISIVAASAPSAPSQKAASAAVVSVIYEVSELLLNFSHTVLAPQCSALITTFAVPNLVVELLRKESRASIGGGGGASSGAGPAIVGGNRSAVAPSAAAVGGGSNAAHLQRTQKLLGLARAARNLVLFLANADTTVPAAGGQTAIALAAPTALVVPATMHMDILHHLSNALRDVAPLSPSHSSAASKGTAADIAHDALQLAYVQAMEATALMLTQGAAAASKSSLGGNSNLLGGIGSVTQAATVAITEVRQQRFLRQRPGAQEVPSADHDLRAGTTFADLAAEFKGAVSPSPCNNNTQNSLQHQLFFSESVNVERALQKTEVALANLAATMATAAALRR